MAKTKRRVSRGSSKRGGAHLDQPDQQRLEAAIRALQQGAVQQAQAWLAQIYEHVPEHPLTNYLLGVVAAGQDRVETAERHFVTAIRRSPDNPGFHFALGDLLARSERFEEAATSFRRALRLDPGLVDAYGALGLVLYKRGQYRAAEAPFAEAIQRAPGVMRHAMNAAANAIACGHESVALKFLDQAAATNRKAPPPDLADLGRLYSKLYRPTNALKAYDAALEQSPDDPAILASKGQALAALHDVDACVAAFQKAAQLRGDPGGAARRIADALGAAGLVEEALEYFQRAEELAPGDFDVRSDQLLLKNYLPHISQDALFEAHCEAAACLPSGAKRSFGNDCTPMRRLKVGYVSADFRQHSVAYFIEPVLENHDLEQYEVYCYYNGKEQDVVTRRLRNKCSIWRDIHELDDNAAADLIYADGIDVLVDLSGHTNGHRLAVFARKPAPVQVSWLGYPNTTGLSQIDYRITDPVVDPPGQTDQWHTETLLRLPRVFSCYMPPGGAPPVTSSPAEQKGYVTFGCFNNANKLNKPLLLVWADILRQVRDSRLILKDSAFQNQAVRERMGEFFAAQGIDSCRVSFLGRDGDTETHLAHYSEIDIALDTHPYCGTTTTCEALWMGVPVVTLAGPDHRSRVGLTQLSALGLSELAAAGRDEYVAIARRLAEDTPRLSSLRAGMRERMAGSPLMDYPRFAQDLEHIYREVWRTWCDGKGAVTSVGGLGPPARD